MRKVLFQKKVYRGEIVLQDDFVIKKVVEITIDEFN